MFSDNMNRKIITLMVCIGLITIGASSAMGMKIYPKNRLVKPLIRLGTLSSTEEDLGIFTGGFLQESSYEIEILEGSTWQIKKLQRALNRGISSFCTIVHLKNIDLKITYTKTIVDPKNSTEFYVTWQYEKEGFEIIDELENLNKPHTVIVKGFTGWFLKMPTGSLNLEKIEPNNFFFVGDYESLEIVDIA